MNKIITLVNKVEKEQKSSWEAVGLVNEDDIKYLKNADRIISAGLEVKEAEYLKAFSEVKKQLSFWRLNHRMELSLNIEEYIQLMEEYLELLKYQKSFYKRIHRNVE